MTLTSAQVAFGTLGTPDSGVAPTTPTCKENGEFDHNGLMQCREASINDRPIQEGDRRFNWPAAGPRPLEHPGLINSPE